MSTRAARALSIVIAAVAIAMIVAAVPVARAARDADRASIVVVPDERRADIEQAIELGGGCPSPGADPALADAVAVYCELQGRIAAGELFSTVGPTDPFAIIASLVGLLWIGTGSLIVARRGTNLAGWIFELVGLGIVALNAMLTFAYVGVAVPGTVPAVGLWAIVDEYAIFSLALLPMLWLLFPDGKPPTPRWGVLVRVYFGALAVVAAVAVLMPGPLNNLVDFGIIYLNPVGRSWIADVGGAVMAAGMITVFAIIVGSVFATRRRFKRADGEERQRLRWLRFVISIAVVLLLISFLGSLVFAVIVGEDAGPAEDWSGILFALLALTLAIGLPAAYLIAIFRYGLWDLDVVIRKTVIVGVVAITLTVVGVGLLLLLPFLTFGVGGSLDAEALIPILIGLVLGVLFGPIRRRARRVADRVVYGRRATPYEVLSTFGDRLSETFSADDVLPRMAQVLAQATGAETAVVWLRVGAELRPTAVWPDAAVSPELVAVERDTAVAEGVALTEVRHQGELLGALSVAMPANDPLDPARQQLVADLAAQAGLVLRNVRLIEELRASRQRLVAAQDEERRKLERDIHDGVQQQLVALSVQLRLAEQLTERDPERARTVLAGLQGQATDALDDLRDLARGIYPPLLADQGLAAALGAQARKAVVPTTIDADGIGRYARDVEATVYFCTLEAMNNIAKYAAASSATISLSQRDGTLAFEVRDDGRGFDLDATPTGTGLVGIADRLDALGGRLTIESRPGDGTTVRGDVPVGRS